MGIALHSLALRAALLVWAVCTASPNQANSAEDATPATFPVKPDPAECRMEPRPLDFFEQFVVTTTPDAVTTTPDAVMTTPFAVPPGGPADPPTVAAVSATVLETYACLHAGDQPRLWSLYSVRLVRERFEATPMTSDVWTFFTAPPQPLPPALHVTILAIRDVRVHADGRVGAFVDYDNPFRPPEGTEVDYIFFVEEGGRLRIDEIVEQLEGQPGLGPATPTQ